jgi:hypothetical protein
MNLVLDERLEFVAGGEKRIAPGRTVQHMTRNARSSRSMSSWHGVR